LDSKEPQILQFLNALQPKSDHIISLITFFQDNMEVWMVFPKLIPLSYHLQLDARTDRLCMDLIQGLAFLHQHYTAHRDIKPDNLVIDTKTSLLKIIDFGCAIQLKNRDAVVFDRCGTKGWMAPEVEDESNSSPYSPIRADRWSCGKTILHIIGDTHKELLTYAMLLLAKTPEDRPALSKDFGLKSSEPRSRPFDGDYDEEPQAKYRKPVVERLTDSGIVTY
jgi:serine/threonine protein kinase